MNVSIRSLTYSYPSGVGALREVSLEIASGERVTLIGQNGSGKTTLVKHLNGLLRPKNGVVLVGGWDTQSHTTAQLSRRVGFMFQNPDEQIFKSRVEDEVAFGVRNLGLAENEVKQRVGAALERTGLAGLAGEHPYELLAGQRKWVALASVLAMDPPVLVLDEPTSGQDARQLARLGALLDELAGDKTVVVVTHDVDFCAEHLERVVVMKDGQVLADGPKEDVLARGELLGETQVEPPQITRLALALGRPPAMTAEEFAEGLDQD